MLSTPAAGAGFGDPDEIVHGRPSKVWHRERLAAQQYLLRLIEESGADCDLGRGAVFLAPSRKNYDALARTVQLRNAYYGSTDHMLTGPELEHEAGGNVGRLFAGGLVMTHAHHVHPAKMITGLASLARSLGATVCEREEVAALQRTKAGFAVMTNGGGLVAQDVLLATGGYTGLLSPFLWKRTLGLPSIMIASEELPADEVSDVFRSGRFLLVNRHRAYSCRPSPDGRRAILAGPVAQTPRTVRDDVRRLHDHFVEIFPDLKGIDFTHCWVGLIAATRDARGHSGAHHGIWYSVGASGIVSCADAGRRMARNILHADRSAADADDSFPRWPLRDSEALLRRGVEWSTALLDIIGRSRLR